MKKNIEEESHPLSEVLIRTNYMTVMTDPADKSMERAVGYGSGFIMNYKELLFFVTADHVVHPDDHDEKQRTGKDYVVSIFNNIANPDLPFSTLVTPVGGFYYADSFNFLKPEEAPKLLDVSVAIMYERHCQNPFLTHKMQDSTGEITEQKSKFILREEHISSPDKNHQYYVCGQVRHNLKGLALYRDTVIYENITYQAQSGDYHLFRSDKKIIYEDWAGLSGSAIFNNEGKCVGVVCSVTQDTHSVWVLGMDKVKLLMDIAVLEEEQRKTDKNNVADN